MAKKKPKLSDFRPQTVNANKHTQRARGLLEKSVREDGYSGESMVAAADGELFIGSHRLEVSGEIFSPDVEPIIVESDGTKPIIVKRTDIPNANDPRAKRLGLGSNRIAQLSLEWDVDVLQTFDLPDLDAIGFNEREQVDFGIREQETKDAEPQVDRAKELQKKWQVQTGDLWAIGEHRLVCGDCTDPTVVERVMGGEKAALAPVDPPYNVGFEYDGETVDDEKTEEKYSEFSHAWFSLCQSVSERQIVTPGCYNLARWLRWFDAYHWAPWTKTNSMTNGKVSRFWCWEPVLFFGDGWKRKRPNDVFDYPISNQQNVGNHPCPKPLPMWIDLIEHYSEPLDIIYEAFGGSGTTMVASENTGRFARVVEVSPEYCALHLQRMADAFPALEIKRIDDKK